jgi:hypothetical protein
MVADEWKHRAPRVEADATKRQGPPGVAADVRQVMAAEAAMAEVGLREADTEAKSRLPHAIATTEYEPTGPPVQRWAFFTGLFHLPTFCLRTFTSVDRLFTARILERCFHRVGSSDCF